MAEEALISKVQDLSDLELATLLCLTTQEHCIIDTEPSSLDDLVHELRLVCIQSSTYFAPLLIIYRSLRMSLVSLTQ
jgi:hypothetical protein